MMLIGVIVFIVLLQKLVVGVAFGLNFKKTTLLDPEELPTVSVLIPARDEAMNLPLCLESLLDLDYPASKLEILVGNDQSVDATAAVVRGYINRYENVRLIDIDSDYQSLVARSNVLAQLASHARNDLLVFLDADMEVSAGWLQQMVAPTGLGYDMVSGYTEVRSGNWFSQFQKMDWMNVIMLLKVGADLNLPGTALGNNMLVSAKAYSAVGGYEKIGPTFTEDNDLTLAFRRNALRVFQLTVGQGALTMPMKTWHDLSEQRNRWMQGAFRQPFFRLLPLLISRVFVLWALVATIWNPIFGLAILVSVSLVEMLLSLLISRKTKSSISLLIAFCAPVFNSLLDTFTLLTFPWNKRVIWKGRKLK